MRFDPLAAGDAARHPQGVLIVVIDAEHSLKRDRDRGHDQRGEQRVPKESTVMRSGSRSCAISSASASMTSTRTNPSRSMNGSRSAATSGGSTALTTAINAATTNAPRRVQAHARQDARGAIERRRRDRPPQHQPERAQAELSRLPQRLCPG